jgi:serine/threonine protein kinase
MDDDLPPVDEVPSAHLEGRQLGNGWSVEKRITRDPGASGGQFSICYSVVHEDGRRAFMKALNFQAASGTGSVVDQLNHFTSAYIFERDLLADCRDKRMSRIVRLIEHGQVTVPEAGALLAEVPFLILEPADGDIRTFQAKSSEFDVAWAFRVMKHTLEGIEQLHAAHTAHQDLKPSNVLTLEDGREMKLGDLGRAERREASGPWSSLTIPGARTYAPPEQQYGSFGGSWEERRAADIYLAGSLGAQLFVGHCMSVLLQDALPTHFRLTKWTGSFAEVLPYLLAAHNQVVPIVQQSVLQHAKNSSCAEEFALAIAQMTQPDPAERGHPRDRAARTSSYAVRRYVSLMNLLSSEVHYRKGRTGRT